jgi:phytoene dehydrogenase-like protein
VVNAIVVGAGANELVAAHTLARAGRRVLVLEERTAVDGANERANDEGWIPPRIVRDLALSSHGLKIEHADPWAATALPGGGRLELWHDVARSVDSIRRVSPRDAARWPEFCARMARLARVLEALYAAPPPDPLTSAPGELLRLAGLGIRVRRLGRQGIEDLLRLLPMPVADLLDDWFESDALKGVLGAAGVMHLRRGPRASGTAFLLLHHHVGSPPGVFRPQRSNIGQVLAGLPGIEIRRGTPVARIDVRDGRVAGVTLASGEAIAAPLVVSGIDPRRTLLELIDAAWLDPAFTRKVRNIRGRGVTARVTLALDRPPGFETLVVAPSLDYLERAADDAKYGRVSRRPYVEARNMGSAGDGRYRVEAHLQYAPCALADGAWHGVRRAALGQLAVEALSEHVPELRATAVEAAVLTPHDLEAVHGWPEGQAHHAELALDQLLWMRPTPALARYRTPIDGLWLCGPAMHPGGAIAGAAGANAARLVLRESRRRTAG